MTDCRPIIGDQHRTIVTWSGEADLGHREGAPVVLRFQLDKAKLFGLEFIGADERERS